jgi:hypothetical protein
VSHALAILVAQGTPLAPPLNVRLAALLVIEAVLLLLVVLLYVKWVQFKNEPLDQWWARRQREGLTPKTHAEMAVAEEERVAAETAAGTRYAASGDAPLGPTP